MCGRARLTVPAAEVARIFGLDEVPHELPSRPEIRPTDPIPIVRRGRDGKKRLELVRWGLVPGWAADPRDAASLINARVETVAARPAFRDAFRERRCLVVADAFFERKKEGASSTPFVVTRGGSSEPFAMAGLWERWVAKGGEVLETCTIITRDAAGAVADLHDRMPVVLAREHHDAWLDPEVHEQRTLEAVLASALLEGFVATPMAPVTQLRLF